MVQFGIQQLAMVKVINKILLPLQVNVFEAVLLPATF